MLLFLLVIVHKHDSLTSISMPHSFCIISLYTSPICFHSEQRHLHNVTFVMFLFLEYLFIMIITVCCTHIARHLICPCDMLSIYLYFGDFYYETPRQQRSVAACSICPYIYTTYRCKHPAYRRNAFVYDSKCSMSRTVRHIVI